MKVSTSLISYRFLLALFIMCATLRVGHAQTMLASTVADFDPGCITIFCGNVGNQSMAVDGDVTTAAAITPPLALSSAGLKVSFGTTVTTIPTGSAVSVVCSIDGGAVNLGLLGQTSIRTYNDVNGSAVQTEVLNNPGLSISVLANNRMQVDFVAAVPFKYLELRTGGALNTVVGSYAARLYLATVTMVAPLPVELVSFAGKARGSAVDLSWETASERNSAYFQVERSAGASDGFQAIGKVAAAGNRTSHARYSFSDAQPLAFGYYRLRQVDADGTINYSPVVSVSAKPLVALQAYPNPATATTTITGPAGTGYTLFNQLGQAVRSGEISPNQTSELGLAALPDGLYFLREMATGNTTKVLKAAGSSGL